MLKKSENSGEACRTWAQKNGTGMRDTRQAYPQVEASLCTSILPRWLLALRTQCALWPCWCCSPRKPCVAAATPLRMHFPLSWLLPEHLIQSVNLISSDWINVAFRKLRK